MDLREEITYDAAPVDVFAMLCDQRFRTEVCQATKALSHSVSVSADGEGAVVEVRRVMPAEVPAFAKKMVGETLEVVQHEQWGAADASGARTGQIKVDIVGQPAGMSGTLRLEACEGGSREVLTGQVSVRIPFVGRKLEPEIARALRAAMVTESRVGQQWLAGRR